MFSSPNSPMPSLLLNEFWGYFFGVKLLWREVNHPPPSRTEVRNDWSHACTLRDAFMARTGKTLRLSCTVHGEDRQNFTFILYPSWRRQAKLYVYLVPFMSRTGKTLRSSCTLQIYGTEICGKHKLYVLPNLYKMLALLSLCVARIKPVSTVTDLVLSRFSPRQNTKR